MSDAQDAALVARARATARTLLRKDFPERWNHTQGVASRAAEIASTVPPADRSLLVAAAWLHDVEPGLGPGAPRLTSSPGSRTGAA